MNVAGAESEAVSDDTDTVTIILPVVVAVFVVLALVIAGIVYAVKKRRRASRHSLRQVQTDQSTLTYENDTWTPYNGRTTA